MSGSTSFGKKGNAAIDPTAMADVSPVSESDEIFVPDKLSASGKSQKANKKPKGKVEGEAKEEAKEDGKDDTAGPQVNPQHPVQKFYN